MIRRVAGKNDVAIVEQLIATVVEANVGLRQEPNEVNNWRDRPSWGQVCRFCPMCDDSTDELSGMGRFAGVNSDIRRFFRVVPFYLTARVRHLKQASKSVELCPCRLCRLQCLRILTFCKKVWRCLAARSPLLQWTGTGGTCGAPRTSGAGPFFVHRPKVCKAVSTGGTHNLVSGRQPTSNVAKTRDQNPCAPFDRANLRAG